MDLKHYKFNLMVFYNFFCSTVKLGKILFYRIIIIIIK